MKPEERRTIGLYTKVSGKEKTIIDQKMQRVGINNLRAYLRKMAVDGYIIVVDMSDVKQLVRLLRSVSNNTNQIAQRVNETHRIYQEDMKELQQGNQKIWNELSKLIKLLKFEV